MLSYSLHQLATAITMHLSVTMMRELTKQREVWTSMGIMKEEESASTANTILWVSTVKGASLVTTDRLGYQRHHHMLARVCRNVPCQALCQFACNT